MPAVRALHARPEKIRLITSFREAARLEQFLFRRRGDDLGWFRDNYFTKGYTMLVNLESHESFSSIRRHEEVLNTFAHESGHGLAILAGFNLKGDLDEEVADLLAGIPIGKNPEAQRIAHKIRKRFNF